MIKKGFYGTQYEWRHVRCPPFRIFGVAEPSQLQFEIENLSGPQPSGSGTGTSDGVRGVGYLQASIEAQRTRPLGR